MASWAALHRLFTRSWWTRAWVMQEVVVAKSIIVVCGGKSLLWNEASQAIIVVRGTFIQCYQIRDSMSSISPSTELFLFSGNSLNLATSHSLLLEREQPLRLRPSQQYSAASRWLLANQYRNANLIMIRYFPCWDWCRRYF
jgi:hypothetical protein